MGESIGHAKTINALTKISGPSMKANLFVLIQTRRGVVMIPDKPVDLSLDLRLFE